MLRSQQVLAQLEAKREDFSRFDQGLWQTRQTYLDALATVEAWDLATWQQHLVGLETPGARPTAEWQQAWRYEFGHTWQNWEQCGAWVAETIENITTFAVDGSQIYVSKDISVPVALIQIGWFENHHSRAGIYTKDAQIEVMTPADLGADRSGEPRELQVNVRRFQLECARLAEYMQANAGRDDCLVFLDGGLVATFAEVFAPEVQQIYAQTLVGLLRVSEASRIPLIAYIDTTYTRDLVNVVGHVCGLAAAPSLHDAQLLDAYLSWGDRTPVFVCARGGTQNNRQGILMAYGEMADRIGFVYLKTNDNYPVRLELPLWLVEAGRLEWALDVVRSEVAIGKGYPYAIETADQVAVLRNDDRQQFLRLMQDWSARHDLNLRLSRKLASKLTRRRR